ncbi:hypothetical protein [Nocardia cyriacigeorgica]|uniref:hypothetical protein n=1 Tax=Nocardia cyriacigeorgica TaxID=135487 RepID=UPI00189580E8|nr:hypothetical protein [Nocardia cyriacigeorgica]MBF6289981.1 hypothetical protein [Nocardia cyriacigeorgica]
MPEKDPDPATEASVSRDCAARQLIDLMAANTSGVEDEALVNRMWEVPVPPSE